MDQSAPRRGVVHLRLATVTQPFDDAGVALHDGRLFGELAAVAAAPRWRGPGPAAGQGGAAGHAVAAPVRAPRGRRRVHGAHAREVHW